MAWRSRKWRPRRKLLNERRNWKLMSTWLASTTATHRSKVQETAQLKAWWTDELRHSCPQRKWLMVSTLPFKTANGDKRGITIATPEIFNFCEKEMSCGWSRFRTTGDTSGSRVSSVRGLMSVHTKLKRLRTPIGEMAFTWEDRPNNCKQEGTWVGRTVNPQAC